MLFHSTGSITTEQPAEWTLKRTVLILLQAMSFFSPLTGEAQHCDSDYIWRLVIGIMVVLWIIHTLYWLYCDFSALLYLSAELKYQNVKYLQVIKFDINILISLHVEYLKWSHQNIGLWLDSECGFCR